MKPCKKCGATDRYKNGDCKSCARARSKVYTAANKDKTAEYQARYYVANKSTKWDTRTAYRAAYKARRRANDVQFKLAGSLRSRLRSALKNNQKVGSAVRDLGCPIGELKTYIEKQFQLGMSWNNWSHTGWHIDHIIPLSKFDLTDREQFLAACHFTNLRPLWAKDNYAKSNKVA